MDVSARREDFAEEVRQALESNVMLESEDGLEDDAAPAAVDEPIAARIAAPNAVDGHVSALGQLQLATASAAAGAADPAQHRRRHRHARIGHLPGDHADVGADPRGVYELKAFFPWQLAGAQGELSGTAVKAMIRRIVAG